MPLFAFFLIISLMEIAVFVAVGERIGILWTLILCILTALIGSFLIRVQGAALLMRGMGDLRGGTMPVDALFDGFCLAIAGVMLVTPGFVTDTFGFILLYPPARAGLRHWLAKKFRLATPQNSASPSAPTRDDDIIDVEYERVDKPEKGSDAP